MSYFGSIGGTNKILAPLGIDLEREGLGIFGDYVDNRNRINEFRNLGLSDADAREFAELNKSGEWNVSSPSSSNNQLPPKQRFLFQVEFILDPKVLPAVQSEVSELVLRKFGFFVKQIDRPKVEYTYEDVNMYNVRTRVLTRITHQPLNMTLWDDARNTVGEFLNLYRKSYTPSARQETRYTGNPEETGFTFSKSILNSTERDFSTRSSLPNNAKNFLSQLIIKQIYSTHNTFSQSPFAMTEYTFFNPVIKTFDFDDINHETGESNGVTVSFDYDNLFIEDYTVASIQPDNELPDYYNFIRGKKINDNLLTLSGSGATKGGTQIPRTSFNLLDEARRAITSGNPVSYVKERAMGILRNGDPNLDFRGVRGVVNDGIGTITGGVSGTSIRKTQEGHYDP